LHNCSNNPELRLHAALLADVQHACAPYGLTPLVVGAFARDLHLQYAHALPIQRKTEDVDCAIGLQNWLIYDAIRAALVNSGRFTARPGVAHALRHSNGLPLDLLPFGGVEDAQRQIAWPPAGEVRMNMLGFTEASQTAERFLLPGGVQVHVVSLAALALLKLGAWREDGLARGGRDATDLYLIARHYADAGQTERLFTEHPQWWDAPEADYVRLGARLLGADLRRLLDAATAQTLATYLADEADPQGAGKLAYAMHALEPEAARALLAEIETGFTDEGASSPGSASSANRA
jgi:predicted nucleotidyltransferase